MHARYRLFGGNAKNDGAHVNSFYSREAAHLLAGKRLRLVLHDRALFLQPMFTHTDDRCVCILWRPSNWRTMFIYTRKALYSFFLHLVSFRLRFLKLHAEKVAFPASFLLTWLSVAQSCVTAPDIARFTYSWGRRSNKSRFTSARCIRSAWKCTKGLSPIGSCSRLHGQLVRIRY